MNTTHTLGFIRNLVLLASLLLLTGCASFNRQWKHTLAQPPAIPASGITGPWEGRWLSDHNGHNGPLRCLISPGTNGTFVAWFHAKYKKGLTLSYAYKVSLKVNPADQAEAVVFSGEEDLGWYAGGLYTYEGTINRTNFFSTYRCPYDHGTFQMSRPAP